MDNITWFSITTKHQYTTLIVSDSNILFFHCHYVRDEINYLEVTVLYILNFIFLDST